MSEADDRNEAYFARTGLMSLQMTDGNSTQRLYEIRQDGKWGLIDRTGKVVVSPQFRYISQFDDGMAIVEAEIGGSSKFGYVGSNGSIISPQFDGACHFSDGIGFVRSDGKWGAIDREGRFVIAPRFTGCDCGFGLSEGLVAACLDDKWGYIDVTGTFVIDPQFDHAYNFHKGWGTIIKGDEKTGKQGLIDRTGKIVIPPEYDVIGSYHDGLIAVGISGKYGFIDMTRKMVIEPQFDWVGPFYDGLAMVQLSGKRAIMDRTGRFVVPPHYGELEYAGEDLLLVTVGAGEDERYGYVNMEGEFVIEAKFEDALVFDEGLAPVKLGGKWGFIDAAGRMVIEPQFPDYSEFCEGLASMRVGDGVTGKYGYIDMTGKFVIEPQFDNASPFVDGLAEVVIGGPRYKFEEFGLVLPSREEARWGYIDKKGEYVWTPTR